MVKHKIVYSYIPCESLPAGEAIFTKKAPDISDKLN